MITVIDKNIIISASKHDNGFGRYNAYEGHSNVICSNNIEEFLEELRGILTSVSWDPEYGDELEQTREYARQHELRRMEEMTADFIFGRTG